MRFVILAFALMLFAGFFHVMFIMFDNMWYSDDSGVIPRLADKLNNSLSEDTQNHSWNITGVLRDAFGLGRVICIVLVPVCIAIEAVDKPKITG